MPGANTCVQLHQHVTCCTCGCRLVDAFGSEKMKQVKKRAKEAKRKEERQKAKFTTADALEVAGTLRAAGEVAQATQNTRVRPRTTVSPLQKPMSRARQQPVTMSNMLVYNHCAVLSALGTVGMQPFVQ